MVRRYGGTSRQIWAYDGLGAAVAFTQQITVLPFDQAAYQPFEALRQQKIRIGSQDLRIAAIVLTAGDILITRNRRDFEQVPGLSIEDWSLAS